VAEIAVELNRRDGFKVWHGPLGTLPDGWVEPKALVAFFMLHHVEEPLELLRQMRERWPDVPIALAQYGPANLNQYSSLAPRNLTRWSTESVRRAFEEAGYDVEVRSYPSSGAEHSVLHRPRSAVFELLIRVPPLYRMTKRIFDRVLPLVTRRVRRRDFVLLALATPRRSAERQAPIVTPLVKPA
jgi:hypothetical protein